MAETIIIFQSYPTECRLVQRYRSDTNKITPISGTATISVWKFEKPARKPAFRVIHIATVAASRQL